MNARGGFELELARTAEIDPAQKLLNELGDTSGIELLHNQVLVAIQLEPEKTKGGIILTPRTRDEGKYQSKLGLVIMKGPKAFVSTEEWSFPDISVGEWILFRPSDGWNIDVNKVPCRILTDTSVKGRVANPDSIW